jgi:hypothetical protein
MVMVTTKTIDHLREGAVARYTESDDLKLAVCVGFGRDYRPRVRLYRAATHKWSKPELVDRTHLVPLEQIEIEGPGQHHAELSKALGVLWTTPELGFRPGELTFWAPLTAPQTTPQATVTKMLVAEADAQTLNSVCEWLFDYFATISDTRMMEILADVAPREVPTFADARAQVNQRIDMMISWLDNTRPSPSGVYEPEAFEQWCKARKKKLTPPPSVPADTEQQSPTPEAKTTPTTSAKQQSPTPPVRTPPAGAEQPSPPVPLTSTSRQDSDAVPPRQPILASYLDLTPEMVRRARATCMDGSELAEACDIFLDPNQDADERAAMAADHLVAVLNQRARSERRILEQLTDDDLLDLERDPESSPAIRWEAQAARGRSKMRMNRSAVRRASAARLCLDYWNASITAGCSAAVARLRGASPTA